MDERNLENILGLQRRPHWPIMSAIKIVYLTLLLVGCVVQW